MKIVIKYALQITNDNIFERKALKYWHIYYLR